MTTDISSLGNGEIDISRIVLADSVSETGDDRDKVLSIDSPFHYIPEHLSESAQEFMRKATPVGGVIKSLTDWEMIRGFFKTGTYDVSQRAKDLYIESVKKEIIADVSVITATPKEYNPLSQKIMIYFHGGAFTLGSPEHLFQIFAPVAFHAGLKVYAIDYRLAPEFSFPSGLDDCFNVYQSILSCNNPDNIFFLGDSAGGNLAIATIFKSREAGLPFPKAIGLYSPWVDLFKKGDSLFSLKGRSPRLSYEKSLLPSAEAYARREDWSNPYISVLNGDYTNFPEVSIHSGTRDALLSDAVRLDRKIKSSGSNSSIELWDGIWHGFQQDNIEEAMQSSITMAAFFKKFL